MERRKLRMDGPMIGRRPRIHPQSTTEVTWNECAPFWPPKCLLGAEWSSTVGLFEPKIPTVDSLQPPGASFLQSWSSFLQFWATFWHPIAGVGLHTAKLTPFWHVRRELCDRSGPQNAPSPLTRPGLAQLPAPNTTHHQ